MEQQEIQERNKQIALMLGAIHSIHTETWGFGNAKNIGSKMFHGVMYKDVIQAQRFEKELKYHSDWNWLMEAIQFLQKHFESKERSWTTIERYPLYSNIEDVFIVVSDFAKLYNNKEL
jgi:myosin-crossreactive antigen